jgi:UDP-glucose 4-epimerase
MRILLTGGTGFIGQHLCNRLVQRQDRVFLLSRDRALSERLFPSTNGNPTTIVGDLADPGSLQSAVKDANPQAVIHLAACVETAPARGNSWLLRVNGEGTYNLLEACVALEPRPIVIYASTMGVYPYPNAGYLPVDERHSIAPSDTYGLSKLNGELACQFIAHQHGLRCCVLRISGVYGLGKNKGIIFNCLDAAESGKTVTVPKGQVIRDYVYVEDVAEAILLALNHPSPEVVPVYNIGSGVGSSLLDVSINAERIVGKQLQVEFATDVLPSSFYY